MINLAQTALLAIDLQPEVLDLTTTYPLAPPQVLAVNQQLVTQLASTSILLVRVTVKVPRMQLGDDLPVCLLQVPATLARHVDVVKHQRDGFTNPHLQQVLQAYQIETLILTGVSTSRGVYETACSGAELGYRVITLADACADRDAQAHAIYCANELAALGSVWSVAQFLQASN